MAKITLPTNYRDDILNSSAEGKRKYVMSYNQDGTVSFEDVTPYEQVGSDFGAGDINTANEAINESFDKNKLVKDLDTINALTEEGFAPDALAVKQLNDSLENKTKWRLYTGNVATSTSLATITELNLLRDEIEEIFAIVNVGGNIYSVTIPFIALSTNTDLYIRLGDSSDKLKILWSNHNSGCIQLQECTIDGTDYKTSAYLGCYVR